MKPVMCHCQRNCWEPVQARNEFSPAVLLMRRDHALADHAKQIASKQAAAPMAPAEPFATEDGEPS